MRISDWSSDVCSSDLGLCIPADERIGPGDRWIYEQIRAVAPNTTLVAIVTKIDRVAKDRVAAQLLAVSELVGPATEIVPVSAKIGSASCRERVCQVRLGFCGGRFIKKTNTKK